MPLIARWPGKVPAGRVSNAQIMSADWLWTAAAIVGGEDFSDQIRTLSIQRARSFVSATTANGLTSDNFDEYGSLGVPLGENRAGDLIPNLFPPPPKRNQSIMFDYRADGYGYCWNQAPRLSILRDGWKLLLNADGSRLELYNHSVAFEVGTLLFPLSPSCSVSPFRSKPWCK